MNRDCKVLNLDECRTREDCATRKKPKSDELMCYKKLVRSAKEEQPVLPRKSSVNSAAKAPRMTAAKKAAILEVEAAPRPKLPFGSQGSLCVDMNETDCLKAKGACQWTRQSADGKRKAHCGKRSETKYDMARLSKLNAPFNYNKYREDVDAPVRPAKAENAEPKANRMTAAHKAELRGDRAPLPFGSKGSLCLGMNESDCGKAKVSCQWTKESKDGKRKAHCGRRINTQANLGELSKLNSKRVMYGELPENIAVIAFSVVDEDGKKLSVQQIKSLLKEGQFLDYAGRDFMVDQFELDDVTFGFKDGFVLAWFDMDIQENYSGMSREEKIRNIKRYVEIANKFISSGSRRADKYNLELSDNTSTYTKSVNLILGYE